MIARRHRTERLRTIGFTSAIAPETPARWQRKGKPFLRRLQPVKARIAPTVRHTPITVSNSAAAMATPVASPPEPCNQHSTAKRWSRFSDASFFRGRAEVVTELDRDRRAVESAGRDPLDLELVVTHRTVGRVSIRGTSVESAIVVRSTNSSVSSTIATFRLGHTRGVSKRSRTMAERLYRRPKKHIASRSRWLF